MARTTRISSFSLIGACLLLATGIAIASERSDEDQARDVHRKPTEVLEFLGLKPGDTVVDVWAAGGWYTEVLSNAVGDDGHVHSQNSPAVLQFRDGVHDRTLTARLAGGRWPVAGLAMSSELMLGWRTALSQMLVSILRSPR